MENVIPTMLAPDNHHLSFVAPPQILLNKKETRDLQGLDQYPRIQAIIDNIYLIKNPTSKIPTG
jgi:hypothetical protein